MLISWVHTIMQQMLMSSNNIDHFLYIQFSKINFGHIWGPAHKRLNYSPDIWHEWYKRNQHSGLFNHNSGIQARSRHHWLPAEIWFHLNSFAKKIWDRNLWRYQFFSYCSQFSISSKFFLFILNSIYKSVIIMTSVEIWSLKNINRKGGEYPGFFYFCLYVHNYNCCWNIKFKNVNKQSWPILFERYMFRIGVCDRVRKRSSVRGCNSYENDFRQACNKLT